MLNIEVDNLTNHQMDGLIATKIMEFIPTKGLWWRPDGKWNCSIEEADSWTFEAKQGVEHNGKLYQSWLLSQWQPHKDLNICFQVEKKIRLLVMDEYYVLYLKTFVALRTTNTNDLEFNFLHATAKQRTEAMIELIRNKLYD